MRHNLLLMIYQKRTTSSRCTKCSRKLDDQHVVIGNGYRPGIPLIRKESVENISTLCNGCGLSEIMQFLENLKCPFWIGLPATNGKETAMNFNGKAIRR